MAAQRGGRGYALDDNYPELIINSINMNEMLAYVAAKDWPCRTSPLVNVVEKLAEAGAALAAIASNTPHIVYLMK